MLAFEYVNPVEVVFGPGSISCLTGKVGERYRRVLLACAKGPFRENGLHGRVRDLITAGGCQVLEMGDIDSNPRLSSVNEGVRICREQDVQAVVALGGGSAMDAVKMIAASAKTGVEAYEYLWGARPPVEDSLDTVMIPTIAATGTELNPSSVVVNDETREKYYADCRHPRLAVMDPELYARAPYRLSVWGAMDIFSHTFEYYFNGCGASEYQLRYSECLIHSVMWALRALKENPADLNARGELLWDAAMAWGGPTKIGRGDPEMTCHSIEESFSGYFDTHHGACLGVLTPRWMDLALEREPAPFARFARNIFGVRQADDRLAAREGSAAWKAFLREIGAPLSFADISSRAFPDQELRHVARTALSIYHGRIGKLRPLDEEEIVALLQSGREAI